MLSKRKSSRGGIGSLLGDSRIRQVTHDDRAHYLAEDVVAVLGDSDHPAELWVELKERHPTLGQRVTMVTLDGAGDVDVLDLPGVFRLAQVMESPRAERIKAWLAEAAARHLEESEDPELALLRARQAYERLGHPRAWIDQRMRSVSARHEIVAEWHRRGIRHGDEFRALTNEMTQAGFGMDVESYRRYKGLFRTGQNLRDHMTDLELALVSLAETTAVEMARRRRSSGFDALRVDAKETGAVIARARRDIEAQIGRPVVSAENHVPAPRPHPANASADQLAA